MKKRLTNAFLILLLFTLSACSGPTEAPAVTSSPSEETLFLENQNLQAALDKLQAEVDVLAAQRAEQEALAARYYIEITGLADAAELMRGMTALKEANEALLAALQAEYALLKGKATVKGAADELTEKFRRGDLRETAEKSQFALLASYAKDGDTLVYTSEWEYPDMPGFIWEYGIALSAHHYNLVRDNLTLAAQAMRETGAASFRLVFRARNDVAMVFQAYPAKRDQAAARQPYADLFLRQDPLALSFFVSYAGLDGKSDGIHQKP